MRNKDRVKSGAVIFPQSSIQHPHSLLISDLHLSPDHTHSTAAFFHFIENEARHAEALYILGDLFEYWAGDDDLHDPFHQRVINALSSLNDTRIYLMHGNRDLLMGDTLAAACCATLLADPFLNAVGVGGNLPHGGNRTVYLFRKRVLKLPKAFQQVLQGSHVFPKAGKKPVRGSHGGTYFVGGNGVGPYP